MEQEKTAKIIRDLEELYAIHEAGVADPTKCREFNSKASLFLESLEEMGMSQLADRMMDILGGCSPKDFSPCDNRQKTKGALERFKERVLEIQKQS